MIKILLILLKSHTDNKSLLVENYFGNNTVVHLSSCSMQRLPILISDKE